MHCKQSESTSKGLVQGWNMRFNARANAETLSYQMQGALGRKMHIYWRTIQS